MVDNDEKSGVGDESGQGQPLGLKQPSPRHEQDVRMLMRGEPDVITQQLGRALRLGSPEAYPNEEISDEQLAKLAELLELETPHKPSSAEYEHWKQEQKAGLGKILQRIQIEQGGSRWGGSAKVRHLSLSKLISGVDEVDDMGGDIYRIRLFAEPGRTRPETDAAHILAKEIKTASGHEGVEAVGYNVIIRNPNTVLREALQEVKSAQPERSR